MANARGDSHTEHTGMLVGNFEDAIWAWLKLLIIYSPKRDDEHPRLFHMGVPPPGANVDIIKCVALFYKLG